MKLNTQTLQLPAGLPTHAANNTFRPPHSIKFSFGIPKTLAIQNICQEIFRSIDPVSMTSVQKRSVINLRN